MANYSYQNIVEIIIKLAESHAAFKCVEYGDVWERDKSLKYSYPLFFLNYQENTTDKDTITYNFELYATDMVLPGKTNELQVISDCREWLQDIVNYFRKLEIPDIDLEFGNNSSPVTKGLISGGAGWVYSLSLVVPYEADFCDTPIDTISLPPIQERQIIYENVLGYQGATGPIGQTGFQGVAGISVTGATGSNGISITGQQGPQGFIGEIGATGASGLDGLNGSDGLMGINGGFMISYNQIILYNDGYALYYISTGNSDATSNGRYYLSNCDMYNNYIQSFFESLFAQLWASSPSGNGYIYIKFLDLSDSSIFNLYSCRIRDIAVDEYGMTLEGLTYLSGTLTTQSNQVGISFLLNAGDLGEAGPVGDSGIGIQGPQGNIGVGVQGFRGFQGFSSTGSQGFQGAGITGATGGFGLTYSGTSTQLAYFNSSTGLTSSNRMIFNGTDLIIGSGSAIIGGTQTDSTLVFKMSNSANPTSSATGFSFRGATSGTTEYLAIKQTGQIIHNTGAGAAISTTVATKPFVLFDSNNSYLQVGNAGGTPGYTNIWLGALGGSAPSSSNCALSSDGASYTAIQGVGSTGMLRIHGAGFEIARFQKFSHQFTPVATSGANGATTQFLYTSAAHTTLAASTDTPTFHFDSSATKQFATGAKTSQSDFKITSPTYSAVGSTTITDAYTFHVTGVPGTSSNVTITNAYAAWLNGAVKIGSGIPGFIFTVNPGNNWNGLYNANVAPSSTNYTLSSNGVSAALNVTSAGALFLSNNGTSVLTVGANTITAAKPIYLVAGTTTIQPLLFQSGTNLTTAVAGSFEYNGTNFFVTRTGTTREGLLSASATSSVSPTSPNLTLTVNIGGNTYYIPAKTTND